MGSSPSSQHRQTQSVGRNYGQTAGHAWPGYQSSSYTGAPQGTPGGQYTAAYPRSNQGTVPTAPSPLNRGNSRPRIMIGFRPEVTGEGGLFYPPQHPSVSSALEQTQNSITEEWDEARDLIFSRILSAEEFLGRMDETDDKIRTMMSTDTRQELFDRILQLLGLRGHLQDELLRIQAMLAEDDPELTKLSQFATSYPRIVQVLKDLSNQYKTADISDLEKNFPGLRELGIQTDSGSTRAVASGTSIDGIAIGIQSEYTPTDGVSVQTNTAVASTSQAKIEEITEESLKQKHNKEEDTVNETIGKKLLSKREQMSKAELDALLAEHLRSMQALRKKQNMEKTRFQQNLRDKIASRKQREQMKNDDISGFDTIEEDEEFENGFDEDTETLKKTIMSKYSDLSEADLKAILSSYRALQEARQQQLDTEKDRHKKGLAAKLAERKRQQQLQNENNVDLPMDDKAIETALFPDPERQEINERDASFIRTFRRKASIDANDFDAMLKLHLNETDDLRRQRLLEKAKLNDLLGDKINSKKEAGTLGVFETDADVLDQKLENELQELKRSFRKKFQMTFGDQTEVERLLSEYRKQQESVIAKRFKDRLESDEKLKEKLAARKSQQQNNNEQASGEVSEIDDKFFKQLQSLQHDGQLDETALASLLKGYVKEVVGKVPQKRKTKTDQEKNEEAIKSASTLVQEHQENTKQINTMRQREKNVLDEKLKRKLATQKKASSASEDID